uniref:AMP-binding domain-containing protein n=1 Tax=Elaeophora elaphi TaxID=1147741 RepID=A0A0R3RX71_9BILA
LQLTLFQAAIFAETQADWLITVLPLFHINVSVTTVYATLGEKAVIQATNETEATLLITSVELLSKLATIRKKMPKLRSLVYFRPLYPSKKLASMN